MGSNQITLYTGAALEVLNTLPAQSVHCCITSPPYYGLRDYGVDCQIGLECTPDEYVAALVDVFRGVWRVLDAQYFGVPQRRERVFIVGSLGNTRCAEVLFERESVRRDTEAGRKAGEEIAGTIGSHATGGRRDDLDTQGAFVVTATETGHGYWSEGLPRCRCSSAPTQPQTIVARATTLKETNRCDPNPHNSVFGYQDKNIVYVQRKDPSRADKPDSTTYIGSGFGVRRLTPREVERCFGFPDDWTRWGADGKEISDTGRYRMLGNAVAPPVTAWLGARIVVADNRR